MPRDRATPWIRLLPTHDEGWASSVQQTQALTGVHRYPQVRTSTVRGVDVRVVARVGQIAADAVFALASVWVAWLLRYKLQLGGAVLPADYESFETFESRMLLFSALAVGLLLVRGVYWLPRSTGLLDEAVAVAGSLTTAMSIVILTAFLTRFLPSRLLFVYAWAAAIILFVLRRAVTRWIRSFLWSRDIYVDRVLLVGSGLAGQRIMQAMMGTPSWGYRVVGFVDGQTGGGELRVATEHRVQRAERVGGLSDVGRVVADLRIDEVIVALPPEQLAEVPSIVEQCRQGAVRFKVVPDLLQLSFDRVDVGEVAGVPLIGMKPAAIQGGQLLLKRGIDVGVALVVLAVFAAPMLVISAMVKLDSPGPVLFRQRRVGRDGTPFSLTKFRCMVDGADEMRAGLIAEHQPEDARLFKLRKDPRLTRLGRLLRRWSLDELPQFLQVLRGEMSLVGPRPQLPEEVGSYEEWHHQRLLVTPGLTGLWQVNGRSNLTFDEMVRLDLYYAEHWSPWLDTKIVLRTIPAVLIGRGAY